MREGQKMEMIQTAYCTTQISCLSAEEGKWTTSEPAVALEKLPNLIPQLPEKSYIFLGKDDYISQCIDRQALLQRFGVPLFVSNRACTDMNGYFGCKLVYDDSAPKRVKRCSTWFRCLVKMVRKEAQDAHNGSKDYVDSTEAKKKGYEWFEMGIFTFWDGASCKVLCVDAPPDLPKRLQEALESRPSGLDFRDPFAMYPDLLDQIILYYDISTWRVRDPVRKLEKYRQRLGENTFQEMHDISRHAIHTAEVLGVTIESMIELQRCQIDVHQNLLTELPNYAEHAKEYTNFQIQLVKSLQHRADSIQRRLQNEVNLTFNNLAHQDNTVMKSIALLTMVFFPATFLSSLFSTTFFTYGNNGWEASPRQWIYWAFAMPVTVLVVIFYITWLRFGRILSLLKRRPGNAESAEGHSGQKSSVAV